MTASICSELIIGRATFPAIWTKKRQVFVPKAAMYCFHLHGGILLSSVTADQINLRMRLHPGLGRFRLSIRQQIDDLVGG